MPSILVSYRRETTAYIAATLHKELAERFGLENVFMDVDTIPAGRDFRKHLEYAVARCDVVVAVIDDRWLDAPTPDGRRRLDLPTDWVRIEIETALKRDVPVIPLLVGGADVPAEAELPEPLRELVYRQAFRVRPGRDFYHDVDVLGEEIERTCTVGEEERKRRADEAEHRRQAEAARQQAEVEAEAAQQAEDEERKRQADEAEHRRQAEAARQQAEVEAEAAQRAADEERKRQADEAERRRQGEVARQRAGLLAGGSLAALVIAWLLFGRRHAPPPEHVTTATASTVAPPPVNETLTVPPVTEPPALVTPQTVPPTSLPTLEPPRIVARKPSGRTVTAPEGGGVEVSAQVDRAAAERGTRYRWLVDGDEVGNRPAWRFVAPPVQAARTQFRVEAQVTDVDGRTAPPTAWTVDVVWTTPALTKPVPAGVVRVP